MKREKMMKRRIVFLLVLFLVLSGTSYASEFNMDTIFQSHQKLIDTTSNFYRVTPVEIFVSFSMPKVSLQQWLRETQKLHIPVAIRGFVEDSLIKTAKKIKEINPGKGEGISIDPKSFTDFGIDKVPAVVVTNATGDFDVVFGNIGLEAALEEITQKGKAGKAEASQLLSQLREP